MRTANNDRWHFTVQTSSQGNSYVYAYQTKWDPVSKTSRRCSKRYVGRLTNDGRVNISDKFAKDFPEYSQGDFYYGADKELVDEATYRHDFPAKNVSDTTEDNAEDDTRSAGLTWAIEQIAIDSGLLEDLTAVFKQDARDLLHLAIYKLDGGRSMAAYDDWRRSVYLRQARCLSSQRISEILSRVTQNNSKTSFVCATNGSSVKLIQPSITPWTTHRFQLTRRRSKMRPSAMPSVILNSSKSTTRL